MRIPVDTSDLMILAGGPARPVTDRNGKQRADGRTGELLYTVDLAVLADDERPERWTVRLTNEPRGLTKGTAVKVTGLSASAYDMTDESGRRLTGLSFRATAIEPVNGKPGGPS